MRELTLLETGYLAGLLLLSLVLPMLMSFRGQRDGAIRRSDIRTVLLGQLLGAVAGFGVLASASIAPYAVGFGVVSCVVCTLVCFVWAGLKLRYDALAFRGVG